MWWLEGASDRLVYSVPHFVHSMRHGTAGKDAGVVCTGLGKIRTTT